MGVPRLFPWIKKKFKPAVHHFYRGTYHVPVEYLYIDANGLLHTAAQYVYNYGEQKSETEPFPNLSAENKQTQTFREFFKLVREVVSIAPPARLLLIALDGPAPVAKQAQQRSRRFVSSESRSGSQFDSNCITPGTEFMFRLTQYLNWAIRNELNPNNKHTWSFEVHFSSSSVPGEGEHKIMDFIRALGRNAQRRARHCFFGLDADLIMLTLSSPCFEIFLLRENQYKPGFYHVLQIDQVRRGLVRVMDEHRIRCAINDFLVIGFFVGNDFLPKIAMFVLLEQGLDFLIYVRAAAAARTKLTNAEGQLHLPGFSEFVSAVAAQEADFLSEQASFRMPAPRFVNRTLLHCMDRRTGRIDYARYRKAYYRKAGACTEAKIKTMCRDYLQGFVWVISYYLHGVPSWSWCYTWHYAPLLSDFAVYLRRQGTLPHFAQSQPTRPFIQLLSVLPPSSALLLPPPYRFLFSDVSSPLVTAGFYPSTFDIDFEGKMKDHMGVALLPFVNADLVRKAFRSAPFVKSARNKRGVPVLFSPDAAYTARFSSRYGDIDQVHVRRRRLS